MSYLICESCNGYYELKEGESHDDFENCQCGGNLRYVDEIIDDETSPPGIFIRVLSLTMTFFNLFFLQKH